MLSVTGKIVENKQENIITEMLCPAHNRIGLTVWHVGCSYYLHLPSVKLPSIFLSEHVDNGCNIFKVHTHDLTPFCGRKRPSYGSGNAWHCWSVIHGLESIFLHERMRQEMSVEGIAVWVRYLSVALVKEISSLHLPQSSCETRRVSYSTWQFLSIRVSKSRFPESDLLQVIYICR